MALLHRRGQLQCDHDVCFLPLSLQMFDFANFLLWRSFFWVHASQWVNDPYPPTHESLFTHPVPWRADFKRTWYNNWNSGTIACMRQHLITHRFELTPCRSAGCYWHSASHGSCCLDCRKSVSWFSWLSHVAPLWHHSLRCSQTPRLPDRCNLMPRLPQLPTFTGRTSTEQLRQLRLAQHAERDKDSAARLWKVHFVLRWEKHMESYEINSNNLERVGSRWKYGMHWDQLGCSDVKGPLPCAPLGPPWQCIPQPEFRGSGDSCHKAAKYR